MKTKTSHSSINTTCSPPKLCYYSLIRKCVSCEILNRAHEETTAVLRVASTTSQEITSATIQKCPALISVVFACAGLVLAMAAVLWFVIQKHKRRTRKRKADEEDNKKTENCTIPFENQGHEGPNLSEDSFVLLRCPHSNDTSHGITLKDGRKMAGSDVTEAASLSSCDEKSNHTIPLPATELGATVLVTTKTTQENSIKEELP